MTDFDFVPYVEAGPDRRVATVPATESVEELLVVIARELEFPGWFGFNWNALLDSLRDLSWIPERGVFIHHPRLPRIPADELRTYLEILLDAVNPQFPARHQLHVSFSPELERAVRNFLEPDA